MAWLILLGFVGKILIRRCRTYVGRGNYSLRNMQCVIGGDIGVVQSSTAEILIFSFRHCRTLDKSYAEACFHALRHY
jgi:hypothetical protein